MNTLIYDEPTIQALLQATVAFDPDLTPLEFVVATVRAVPPEATPLSAAWVANIAERLLGVEGVVDEVRPHSGPGAWMICGLPPSFMHSLEVLREVTVLTPATAYALTFAAPAAPPHFFHTINIVSIPPPEAAAVPLDPQALIDVVEARCGVSGLITSAEPLHRRHQVETWALVGLPPSMARRVGALPAETIRNTNQQYRIYFKEDFGGATNLAPCWRIHPEYRPRVKEADGVVMEVQKWYRFPSGDLPLCIDVSDDPVTRTVSDADLRRCAALGGSLCNVLRREDGRRSMLVPPACFQAVLNLSGLVTFTQDGDPVVVSAA